MSNSNGKIMKILIAVLSPILIIILVASSFFAILDGLVNLIEQIIANVVQAIGEFFDNPSVYISDAWATFSNWIDEHWVGGNDVFDPESLGIQRLGKPSIVVSQADFENIKKSIDDAKVNRNTAGLEDYMLKVMLLSYYRSVYLSDFNILMQITEEEKDAIQTMNSEAMADPNKYPCPFRVIDGDASQGEGRDGCYYLKTSGMIKIETEYEDFETGDRETKELEYFNKDVIDGLYDKYLKIKNFNQYEDEDDEENDNYADSIKEFLSTVYTRSDAQGQILVPVINDSEKKTIYNYDDPEIEDYTIREEVDACLEYVPVNYDILSAKYGNPVEHSLDLLEITGSRDFLNAFISVTSGPEYYIKLELYDLTTVTTNITQEKYKQDTVIEGEVELDLNYEVRYEDPPTPSEDESALDILEDFFSGIFGALLGGESGGTESSTRAGTIATMGIHYSTFNLSGDKVAILINESNTETQDKIFNLYVGNNSGIAPSTIAFSGLGGRGWIVDLDGGKKLATKTKTGTNVSVVTVETNNEGYYDTCVKEVNSWWCNIKKKRESTPVIRHNNISEAGKSYLESDIFTSAGFLDNSNIKELLDEDNGYITGRESIDKPTEVYDRITNSAIFYLNVDGMGGGFFRDKKEKLLNKIFNGVINDDTLEFRYGTTDAEHEEVRLLLDGNYATIEGYEYNKMTLDFYSATKDNISIERTVHSTGGATTGDYQVDKILGLLRDASGNKVEYADLYKSKTGAGDLLVNGDEMLFQLLDSSENTEGLSDVWRYILYRYSGKDYGVTSFVLDPYALQGMTMGATVIGDSIEDKVWCTLISRGYSPEAVAGAMGNIYAESGFDPNIIEYGSGAGFGLCQWTGGRRTQLEAYAAAKGVSAGDINTQIEFLVGELTVGGGASGYATYQLMTTSYSGTTYSPSDWTNATSPEDGAAAFCFTFERPDATLAHLDTRKAKAREYYNKYAGKSVQEITGTSDVQVKIADVAKNSSAYGITPRDGFCLGWVFDVYDAAGASSTGTCCAYCAGYKYGVSKDFSNIPVGAAVYRNSNTTLGRLYGHVGIYVGDGMVADNAGGYIRHSTLESFLSGSTEACWGWAGEPVNPSYPITQGLIGPGKGSDCYY